MKLELGQAQIETNNFMYLQTLAELFWSQKKQTNKHVALLFSLIQFEKISKFLGKMYFGKLTTLFLISKYVT